MTSPQQTEILDIRHFAAKQLRPLLEEEAAQWLRRLNWDYRSSTDLLLQYLDSRILPGFVALERGRVCGYAFCVYEGHKAVIGDVFATSSHPAPLGVCRTLARHLLETLTASPEITRIEAQLLLFDSEVLGPLFADGLPRGESFRAFRRMFLEHVLADRAPAPPETPAGFELRPWNADFYHAAAELIQAAYVDHIDSAINDQYRTLAGSLRFLHNIVRFPGCGSFDPFSSWMLLDRESAALAGVILCSRVAPETAHITQLCVAPGFRHRGLGEHLLRFSMSRMRAHRYRSLTLTVTAENTEARRLYAAAEFRERHRFDALVLDKQPHRMALVDV